MKTHISIIRNLACLLAIVLLAGCVSSGPRRHYLEVIDSSSLTNLTAYRIGTNLEIRYPLHGHEARAFANWPAEQGNDVEYQYRYAVLAFDKESRATRRSLAKQGTHPILRDAKQWRSLVDEVFDTLMPSEAGHGVLVLVQNQEIALYRDKQGSPKAVKLGQKPEDIVIDHAYGYRDFARAAIASLQKGAETNRSQYLFTTGGDPAFVLVDLRERLMVFLSYPIDPDSEPRDMAGWFPFRAMRALLFRGFVLGTLKNPFTFVSRGIWHFATSGARALDTAKIRETGPPPPLQNGPGMDLATWEKHLDHRLGGRRYKGKVDFLIDGEQFFPALIKSVENAVRSVDVMVFIFGGDEYAVTIANVLKNRSSAVRVRVLMDDMGSLFGDTQPPPASAVPPGFQRHGDMKAYLMSGAKTEVRTAANPWLTIDHRKCIIVDNKVAYVGGMNIGWQYRYAWHDMMARVTGPVVARLEKDYEEAWAHAGILGDLAYAWACLFDRTRSHKIEKMPDGIDIRTLRTATWNMEIYRAQLDAIRRAKNYIYIENAYFNDQAILRELIRARWRGVDVRVVLPSKNDSGVMQTSNLIMANEMVSHGIRVYSYPGMTHVKAAIYDGWACIGSANLEKMSLRVSQELDIAFSDPATVDRLKRELFEKDFKRSREVTGQEQMNWMDSFIKAFADQL